MRHSPFYFRNNVIVNTTGGNGLQMIQVSAPGQVIATNTLTGSPSQGILDSFGNLTAGYAQYVGTMGYQLGSGGGTTRRHRCRQRRTNVRIIR